MAKYRLIFWAAIWGIITPIVVLITFGTLTWWLSCCIRLPHVNSLIAHPFGEPYRLIFALGIMFSLWAQGTITCYFDDRQFFHKTKLPKAIEKGLRFEIPLFLGSVVLVSLMSLDSYRTHLVSNFVYLIIVSILDFFYFYKVEPRDKKSDEDKIASEELKKCCRQLFWHVDLVIVLSIVLAFLFVWFFPTPLPPFTVNPKLLSLPPSFDFSYLDRLTDSINRQWSGQSNEPMTEIFISGVIGVLLLLTVILIIVHLYEWEKKRVVDLSVQHEKI
jgi:hypothetical protein